MGRRRLALPALAAGAALTVGALVGPPATAAPEPPTPTDRLALEAGLQVAPKGRAGKAAPGPNPYLANLLDLATADFAGWRTRMAAGGDARARSSRLATARRAAANRVLPPVLLYDEQEAPDAPGANDTQGDAEPVEGFGTGRRENQRARVLGSLTDLLPDAEALRPGAEDNGQLDRATPTGIDGSGRVTTTGVIGDGPHGSSGSGSGDFDFYALSAEAGLTIAADTLDSNDALDTVVVLYDAAGEIVAANDDAAGTLNSSLEFEVPTTGTYYVLVTGFLVLPEDPDDSGSGDGFGEEGPYSLDVSAAQRDSDFFAFDLAEGDVLGASVTGSASRLTVYRVDGTQMVGSQQDASSIYAPESPLPGGGNAVLAYVAEEPGRYAVRVDGAPGRYDATVEAYRPGSETDPARRVQTVFLDFDGARVNTGIFGGPGVRTLSPFSSFLARWGIPRSAEADLVRRITDEVRENVQTDLVEQGLNDDVAVRVVNSRTSPDLFGRANVSRVIVGGTIEQSGVPTIGIAQSIDPGNFGHEETALVLLDVLSLPGSDDEPASLNSYLTAASDRSAFVSQAVGNIIAHEVGHYIGNFHTDNVNEQASLMDQGGTGFERLFGVGPDGVGGTADDDDVDFVEDSYVPNEGFTGLEDTLNVAAWAFVEGRRGGLLP